MSVLILNGVIPTFGGYSLEVDSPSGGGGGGGGTSTLANIPGASDVWDGTTPSGMLDSSGTQLTKFAGSSPASLRPLVSGGVALQAAIAGPGNTVTPGGSQTGYPHVNGLLGGMATMVDMSYGINGYGLPWPILGQTSCLLRAGTTTLSANSDWWFALAWSRPNLKTQDGSSVRNSTDTMVLAQLGFTPIVWLDNACRNVVVGSDTGTLRVLGTAVATNMPLRHCATIVLANHAGAGISVYLNGSATPVATGITCPFGSTPDKFVLMGNVTDGYFGGSQCWFHEAGIGRSLSSGQVTSALASLSRYITGPGIAIRMPWLGQSNLDFVPGSAIDYNRKGIAYYLSALSVDLTPSADAPGQGLYYSPNGVIGTGTYLVDGGLGSDPSTWGLGATGTKQINGITGMLPIHQADLAMIMAYYSEDSSSPLDKIRPTYDTAKPTYEAAWLRYISLVRSAVAGKTAANVPLAVVAALSYSGATPPFLAMIKDGWNEIASSGNVGIVVQNCWDAIGRGGTNPFNGDGSHCSDEDHQNNLIRAAAPMARMLEAAGYVLRPLPPVGTLGGIAKTGPLIPTLQFCDASGVVSSTPTGYVLVTANHDTGNALAMNGTSPTGIGWTVRDGWVDVSNRGAVILATAATLLDTTPGPITQSILTLASVPTNPKSACRGLYCEGPGAVNGPGRIGTGCAITDNAGSVTPVAGYDIANDLGATFACNYPLPSTPSGIPFS